MASNSVTHPGLSHRIPGIQPTYIDAHPDHPYTGAKSPKGRTQHQTSPSPRSSQSHSQQLADIQEKINQLQLIDDSRAEAIVEQKIEIAILKNELGHARCDKEAIISSFGIVIESITRGACVTPSPQVLASSSTAQVSNEEKRIKALEKEIERHRKSDRVLRARILELERGIEVRGCARERENEFGSIEREHSVLHGKDGWGDGPVVRSRAFDKGKSKMVESEVGSRSGSANSPERQQDYLHTIGPGPSGPQLVGSWGEDIGAELPTIPNSPVVRPVFNPENVDVGFCSLEDFLDNDGFPPPISTNHSSVPSTMINSFPATSPANSSSLSTTAQIPRLPEDERHIDEQIEENKKAMAIFANMLTPGVIKTGFARQSSYQGADYDKMKVPHPTRDFDRFAPNNFRSIACYSSPIRRQPPTSPRVSFDTPSSQDRSFDRGVWDDSHDRNGAVEAHMRAANGRNDTRFPDFFRYGIQYIPAGTDSNYMRTVILGNLALGTEIRDVLARVRGGDVISATVVKMGLIAQDTLQARVVFKHEASAEEYALYAAEHPISFAEGNVAEVTLVSTPTYPLSTKTQSRLREQTRCIAIPNIPHNFSINALEHNLACGNGYRAQSLIEMYIDKAFTLHLEFSTVELANSAWNILHCWNMYRGLQCRWEADPCAGEVEELASEVKPRPKIFPDNWASRGAESDDKRSLNAEGRKPFAAPENQQVSIPDFSAVRLQTASWADEVNGDFEDEEDDRKVVTIILDELAAGRNAAETESSGSSSSSGSTDLASKSASVSCVATYGSGTGSASSTPIAESSSTTLEGSPAQELAQASPSTTVHVNRTTTVLTVDQELQAALCAANTNHVLATTTSSSNSISTAIVPVPGTQKSLIGLAGSKYASSIPAFVDSGRRPRSIHIKASTSSTLSTSKISPDNKAIFSSDASGALSPQSKDLAMGTKQRFSASPPRVDLDGLIKSGRSSFASACASASFGENIESEAEDEIRSDEKIDFDTQAVAVEPKIQLFRWFQPASVGGKKHSYGMPEQEIDEENLRIPIEELGGDSSSASANSKQRDGEEDVEREGELKVVNPNEISLDDEDYEETLVRDLSSASAFPNLSVGLGEKGGEDVKVESKEEALGVELART
ncbi:hypothetical protein BKA65DRAFT_590505 [Rhexocercosporidium sp. MPI-PUGE-AT-0058]|nr:hypothetical protein BKA65DRAFT_590505 [Rhexocercosporidium sp. MPI-PUGE-AT-0058]